jgi:large subunit ribosomal protein L18
MKKISIDRKLRRKLRVSKKIFGTAERPRISIYRSSKYIYAQAIDDVKRITVCAASSKDIKEKMKKSEQAKKSANFLQRSFQKRKFKQEYLIEAHIHILAEFSSSPRDCGKKD